jgi:hypothetical protein
LCLYSSTWESYSRTNWDRCSSKPCADLAKLCSTSATAGAAAAKQRRLCLDTPPAVQGRETRHLCHPMWHASAWHAIVFLAAQTTHPQAAMRTTCQPLHAVARQCMHAGCWTGQAWFVRRGRQLPLHVLRPPAMGTAASCLLPGTAAATAHCCCPHH